MSERPQHFRLDLCVGAAASCGHMEGVVGILQRNQCRGVAELFHERLQQRPFRKRIARALQKKQRNIDFKKMLRPGDRRLFGRVKRESEEGKSVDVWK